MRLTLAALLCGLVVAMTPGPVSAEESPGNLVLISDSFAGGELSDSTKWFNRIATRESLTLQRTGSAGSGMLKASHHCAPKGLTFGQRLPLIAEARPKKVIVADGINDRLYCRKGKYTSATDQQVRANIDAFMRSLAISVQKVKVPRDDVFIVLPWSQKTAKFKWILDYTEVVAKRHGFTPVKPYLTVNETTDGFHLNQKGQDRLTQLLIQAMG